jgi:hypothetical protein
MSDIGGKADISFRQYLIVWKGAASGSKRGGRTLSAPCFAPPRDPDSAI